MYGRNYLLNATSFIVCVNYVQSVRIIDICVIILHLRSFLLFVMLFRSRSQEFLSREQGTVHH